ncbi:hypothetical protein EON81_22750 [bacterium]|nr:MAG: hypothetical protein EON81_22750 [bacterium]
MKRSFFSILFLAAAGLASAQVVATRDNGNTTIRGTVAGYKLNADRSTRYVLHGTAGNPASISQRTAEGTLDITAQQELDITFKTVKGKDVVTVAKATGNVKVVRTLVSDKSSTTITGSQADYSRKGDEGTMDLAGPVKIVRTNEAKKQIMIATGKRGQAVLLPDSKKDSLRSATLIGDVDIDVEQAPYTDPDSKEVKAGRYKAGGGRLVYDLTGALPKVTLTENVRLDGQSDDNNMISTGIAKLLMNLNEKNELVDAEAFGGPVETIVTPKKPGGK